jgi:phenylalanyl-tRNA synthetase alpha chain
MAEYELTEEGKKYLKQDLPEKNLAALLRKGPVGFNEVKNKIENFAIAMQWVKKKGWAEVRDGKLSLVKFPELIEEEDALKKINAGKDVDDAILKILLERNLVKKITETYKKTEFEIKTKGGVIGRLTHDIIVTGLWKGKKFEAVNVQKPAKKIIADKVKQIGKRQPYEDFLIQVRKKMVQMGFREMSGPMIELEFWNFDALFQPQHHPARTWSQTYSLKYPKFGTLPSKKIVDDVKESHENGWKYKWDPRTAMKLMPRAHTTCLSARTLAGKHDVPGKYFALSRCFRPDVIDATHGVEFNQLEGIVVGDVDFKNLLGVLKEFAKEIAGAERVKFLPDYYPFTEPSAQISAKHPELGWIEFGGSGVFREEWTRALGVKQPVLAWGMGIDRLAMFKLKINDIRELFSRNLEWLRG